MDVIVPPDAGNLSSPAPDGFRPIRAGGPYIAANGPLFLRQDAQGAAIGLRIEARHCNPLRIAHGGFLATMADMVLPLSTRASASDLATRFLITVSLSIDYLGQAPEGAWLEGRGEVLRRTTRLVFAQCLLRVDNTPVLRASGVMRIGPEDPAGFH